MNISRRRFLSGCGAAGLVGLQSCSWITDKKPPGHFSLGMVEFPGYAPWYLAHTKGFFGATDVSLRRIAKIGDIRSAFRSGQLDGYVATFDIFQAIEDEKPPGLMVMPLVSSNGGDGVVVSAEVKDVADLRGKQVAGERGLPPVFILQYLLNKRGMSLADIKFRDVPSNDVPATFLKDRLAAAGTYQPLLDRAVAARAGSRILATSKDTPRLITDFLVTSDEALTTHMETLKDLAGGWFQAVKYIKSNPSDAMTIMAAEFSIKTDEMSGYGTEVAWLSKEDGINLMDKSQPVNAYSLFDEVGQVLKRNNPNIQLVSAAEAIDSRLMKEIGK